jgi:hypothetical protein
MGEKMRVGFNSRLLLQILVASFGTMAASSAWADATIDMWTISNVKVQPSFVTHSDGTIETLDPKVELLVSLSIETVEEYGQSNSRTVKEQHVIPPSDSANGKIVVVLQSKSEKACERRGGGGHIISMGPHTARLKLALKPGKYDVTLDGIASGLLDVEAADAKYVEQLDYKDSWKKQASQDFSSVFGNLAQEMTSMSPLCSVQVFDDANGIRAVYDFPSTTEILGNGDTLIKKEIKGAIEFDSVSLNVECGMNSNHWSGVVKSRKDQSAELKISFNSQGIKQSRFTIGEKSCN